MKTRAAQTLSRILVPLDGSELAEQALPYAWAVGGPDAALILLQVIPWAEDVRTVFGKLVATFEEVQAAYEAEARQALERAVAAWFGDRPNVSLEVAAGDPAEQILWAADRHAVDLIIMASHGRGAIGRWTFGSVADRVARTANVPVMIVRPRDAPVEAKPPQIRRVVVPLDGSPLAEQALPVAAAIARHLGVPVGVLRVVDPARLLTRSPVLTAPVPSEFYETAQTALRSEAERTVSAAVDHLRGAGLVADGDVYVGHPARSIMDATTPGDVVVLTSHGRSGVRRWLLGSVAEKLIRNGPVPVVLVPASVRAEAAEPADVTPQAIRPAPA